MKKTKAPKTPTHIYDHLKARRRRALAARRARRARLEALGLTRDRATRALAREKARARLLRLEELLARNNGTLTHRGVWKRGEA